MAISFLFFDLSTKNKKRSNLCELCVSAVKYLTVQIERFLVNDLWPEKILLLSHWEVD